VPGQHGELDQRSVAAVPISGHRHASSTGPSRAIGVGDQRARIAPGEIDQYVRRQRRQRPEVAVAARLKGQRGDLPGQRPAGGLGEVRDRVVRGRWVHDDQVEQPPPAAFHLARHLRGGLGIPPGAGVGELVEVQEDGLTHRREHAAVHGAARGPLAEPAPGHPGAEAQRVLQWLQAGPGPPHYWISVR
jgi:hypothetical protein